ncbi:MAG: hypothetical protein H6746_05660 [Deltaproteobacteria bacterium]|nr:hypothetical protein [Deltaproteobacteria bacterium]
MLWGGDQDTDWDRDDGLPTIISIATHVGLSGVPVFGSDIAGYSSFAAPATTKELFLRWDALAALQPVMRTHHGSSECANWSFDRDAETLAHHRRWASVHVRLLPLFRALTKEAVASGLPLVRHPWLVEPDHPPLWAPHADLFFLGDDLLVAPVVTEGATTRTLDLPGEGWWPLLGQSPIQAKPGPDGLVALEASAPVTELPAFVRPGAVLPLTRQVVDSFYGATEPGITDRSDLEGLTLALYPDTAGALAPQEVAGVTIEATNLSPTTDLTKATWDGSSLPACTASSPTPPCATPAGALLPGPGTLSAGTATITLTGTPDATPIELALAGRAFGTLANPTPMTNLTPDIPPPCE